MDRFIFTSYYNYMKFAVVEYSSKTGGIWYHRDDRPNYLADPQHEIDPTSFGCYVSALKGEHIPLLGLITGKITPSFEPVTLYRKLMKRWTNKWPTYSLEYLTKFDALLYVHQLSNAHELVAALQRLRQLPKRPFIIGVPTQPYGILVDALQQDTAAKKHFIDFMDACDVFISIVEDTTSWYAAQTKTPVEYLPQPYPAHYATRFYQPQSAKKKTILVAGVTQRDNIRKGQLVAKKLQQQHPEYDIIIPKVPEYEYDESNLIGSRFEMLPFEEWQQHLETLARTSLVINTDYTFTRGRVQADCAAVGTPSVGSNSDGQRDLFPEQFSLSKMSVDKLVAISNKLLTDRDYFDRTTAHATKQLKKYDYEASAERLQALVDKYQKR